jgi:hypothetical protein
MIIAAVVQQHAAGQDWEKDIEFGVLGGMEWNVFHSPETYVDNNGVLFPSDSIVLDDGLTMFDLELDLSREDANGEWFISGDGGASRYRTLSEANRRSLDLRAGRTQTLNNRMTAELEGRLRDEKRLGINILGDELLTSFSFTQAQLAGQMEMEVKDDLALILDAELYRKWYAERVTGVSLDQTEWSINLETQYVPRRRKRGLRNLDLVGEKRTEEVGEFSLDLGYRQKNYANWLNEDILDPNRDPLAPTPFLPYDSLYSHPLRMWTYATATLRYEWPEWQGWRLRTDLRTQRRSDLSLGDFGYRDVKGALRLDFDPGQDLELSGSISYTWREYTDRLAEQQTPTPFPLLKYNYLRIDASAEYRLRKGLLLLAMLDFTQRTSNTTAIDRRTRREYNTATLLVGLSAEIK